MMNLFSKSETSRAPAVTFKKLSDYLFELYAPVGNPEVDIVFFHGLQRKDYTDAYWKTWSNDGKTAWPKTLLAKAFPKARMLSVSYDSLAQETASGQGTNDLHILGENMVKDIIENNKVAVGRGRPVFLIGHSLGGLVIKKFLISARDRKYSIERTHPQDAAKIDKFLENISGIVYYATPNGGSRWADVALQFLPIKASPVLRLLATLNTETSRLNEDFRKWRALNNKNAFIFAEAEKTRIMGQYVMVVEEGSARADHDHYFTVPHTDHISVCKPETETDGNFHFLAQFIEENVPTTSTLTRAPEVADLC